MSPDLHFIHMLVVKTIADVTGDDADELEDTARVPLEARDWEQVVSRLEALFDCTLDLLTRPHHVLDIAGVASEIARHVGTSLTSSASS
jgi:hypothetical protein